MRFNKLPKTLTIAVLLCLATSCVQAVELGGIEFKGSGFLTIAAGKVLNGGVAENAGGYNCPCFLSDYSNAAIYQNSGVNLSPDSKLGLQGSAAFNNSFSLTGQVMARGARNGNVNLEWLYGTVRLNNNLTLQVGRKRLPLSFYSESQDIGQSYPWVHLPPQTYGWDAVNYNGANLSYEDQWGNWSSGLNMFTGSETVKDNGYLRIYNGKNTRADSRWSNIYGVNLNLSRDWFETRLIYLQSNIQNTTPPTLDFGVATRQKIYGISFMADYEQWVARSEFMYVNRDEYYGSDHTQLLGLGYHLGKFLPMVTYANYRQSFSSNYVLTTGVDPLAPEAHSTISLLLRYSLTSSSDLKLQFERWQNNAQPQYFNGTLSAGIFRGVNLLSASYDIAF